MNKSEVPGSGNKRVVRIDADAAKRTDRFQDNSALIDLLSELKQLLEPVQQQLGFVQPKMPVGAIVGNPRSGTTLFQQWLASLGLFAYPSNLLTRFAYAPYVGALVQKMLFDPEYDFHNEFTDVQSAPSFESDLGKSKGALGSNEFQHFFRNHMPNFNLEWLDEQALEKVDCAGMAKGLASIEQGFGKPFTTKAHILQLNIGYFAERIPSLFWIHVIREPLFVMQSILLAREAYYGDRNTWWSSRPKEYELLKEMDVHHQIAGQVYFTEKGIRDGLKAVKEEQRTTVQYEAFCADPGSAYRQIAEKYSELGCELPSEYSGSAGFRCSNEIRLPKADIDGLQAAYDEFQNGLPVE